MVMEDLVKKVNGNFKRLHSQAIANRENPTIVEMLDNLVQLTTITAPAPSTGTAPINSLE